MTRNYYNETEEEDLERSMTADEVYVSKDKPRWTGLYDAEGQKLYRPSVKIKIGFDLSGKN
jgi:hypothetical protein